MVFGCLIILLVIGLIFSSGYQAFASARDKKTIPAPGQMVDVGGHCLHIVSLGKGDPTVVMEAGMSGWSTDWSLIQSEIAKVTRVYTYDRAGYGWSDPGPQPRDSQQAATELHTLLAKSGIDRNLLLVGHSLGGLFVQYYAKTYPQQVAGIILVDSVHPEQSLRMEEGMRKKYEENLRSLTFLSRVLAPSGLLRLAGQSVTIIANKLPNEYRTIARSLGFQSKTYQALDEEMASFQASQAEVRDAGPLPKVPLVVISSSFVEDFPPGFSTGNLKSIWDKLQADLANSSEAPQIIAENSGHYIHLDQPELVIQSILEMIGRVRGK